MHDRCSMRAIAVAALFAVVPGFSGIPDTAGVLTIDTATSSEKIVITASRSKRRVSETPAGVSVITKNTIASSPAKTIEDLIATQPGVQVKRSVCIGEGIPSDIIIRGIPGGLAATRTLILVDGIPTNASGTPFLMVNEIPMDAIERIEIVRGPYSSLYGANALGGVINIITQEGYGGVNGTVSAETGYPFSVIDRMYTKNLSVSKALDTAASLTYYNTGGTVKGGTDKVSFVASGGYRTIGNYLLRDTSVKRNGPKIYPTSVDNHDYREDRFFGKGRLRCTDKTEISLHVRYLRSALGFGKTSKILPDSADVDTKGWKVLVGPQIKIAIADGITFRAGAFVRHVEGEFWNEGKDSGNNWVPSYWKSQTNDWQVESQCIARLGRMNTLTAGIEFLDNRAKFGATENVLTGKVLPGSFTTKNGIKNGAFYLQDEFKPLGRLNIVPAARLDYHSIFGTVFSPKLGISYTICEALRFRSSAGRSFRAPSLAELYLPDFPVVPDVALKADPQLNPEYVSGFDFGFDIMPTSSLTLRIGPYYNRMKDLISQTVVVDTSQFYGFGVLHRNISIAWSEGIEGEMEWRLLRWLTMSSNGTIMKSRDETYKTTLDYIPNYMADCRIAVTRKFGKIKIDGQAGLKRVGSRSYLDFANDSTKINYLPDNTTETKLSPPVPLPPYHTIDFSCKIAFPHRVFVSLMAQNILNAQYEEAFGTFAPGRFATIKVGYAF